MTKSVGEDMPKQMARVREAQANAREIGPSGAFYVAMCEGALKAADRALAGGDIVEILRAYKALQEIQE